VSGIKECSKCGKPAWREANSRFFKCLNGHRTGNKYGAKSVKISELQNGELLNRFGHFDSMEEMNFFKENLGWLEIAGKASKIGHHTKVELVPGISYETDWDYFDENGVYRVVDVKGVITERFKIIMGLWPIFGVAPLDIVKRGSRGWITRTIQAGKWDAARNEQGQWTWRKTA
jgi:hypothetical protein